MQSYHMISEYDIDYAIVVLLTLFLVTGEKVQLKKPPTGNSFKSTSKVKMLFNTVSCFSESDW